MSSDLNQTFIVGDVHGCFTEFMALLKKASYDAQKHRLILVGDLINKGPDSLKVLKWVYDNKVESVVGNHELKFIELVEKNQELPEVLKKLKSEMGSELDFWIQYLKNLPTYIEEESFMVVHAGLIPQKHPSETPLADLVNIRHWDSSSQKRVSQSIGKPWHEFYTSSKLIVYGHWARQGFLQKENSICLDSGCVYGNALTGVFLPSREIIQISSSRLSEFRD